MTENITTTEAPAVAEKEGKEFIKPSGWKADKDWSYLADKEPDASHYLKAEMMLKFGPQEGMPELTIDEAAKVVQVFLSMHRWMQQSDLNQSRPDFRGRTWESVEKGYLTLAERAAKEIAEKGPEARMVETPRAVTGLKAEEVLAGIMKAPSATEEEKEEAKEALVAAGADPEQAKEKVPAEAEAKVEEAVAEEKPAPKTRQRRAPRKTQVKSDLKVGADS